MDHWRCRRTPSTPCSTPSTLCSTVQELPPCSARAALHRSVQRIGSDVLQWALQGTRVGGIKKPHTKASTCFYFGRVFILTVCFIFDLVLSFHFSSPNSTGHAWKSLSLALAVPCLRCAFLFQAACIKDGVHVFILTAGFCMGGGGGGSICLGVFLFLWREVSQ